MELLILSVLIFALLLLGRSFKAKNKKLHVRITSIAVLADISLVLYLAIHRGVLTKINSNMPIILIIHISLALIVVFAYLFAIYYGIRLGKGEEQYRNKMKFVDKLIIPCRFLVIVTMLFLKWNS
ncbi:MAG: hypothetical protein WA160_02455 [Pseudobdellovibrio sp.]